MVAYPQQEQVLDPCTARGRLTDDEADYDYDEYEFRPSVSPHVLFPVGRGPELLPPLEELSAVGL